ncbi:MAG: hypothetical protein ACFFD4_22650 [Candidatus Odinarchaeota archaeon]
MPVHRISALDSRVLSSPLKLQHLTTGNAKDSTNTYQSLLVGRRCLQYGVYLSSKVTAIQWTAVEIK